MKFHNRRTQNGECHIERRTDSALGSETTERAMDHQSRIYQPKDRRSGGPKTVTAFGSGNKLRAKNEMVTSAMLGEQLPKDEIQESEDER